MQNNQMAGQSLHTVTVKSEVNGMTFSVPSASVLHENLVKHNYGTTLVTAKPNTQTASVQVGVGFVDGKVVYPDSHPQAAAAKTLAERIAHNKQELQELEFDLKAEAIAKAASGSGDSEQKIALELANLIAERDQRERQSQSAATDPIKRTRRRSAPTIAVPNDQVAA